MKVTKTPNLSFDDNFSRQTIGSGRRNINRSVMKFREP